MIKGSAREEPSGCPKVNSLQEKSPASLSFWFSFLQCGHTETVPGFSSNAPRGGGMGVGKKAGKVRFCLHFFLPNSQDWVTSCQLVNPHYEDFPKEQPYFLALKALNGKNLQP